MVVAIKEPGGAWERRSINSDLKTMQDIVGGWIEAVTFSEDLIILCNEEGRIDNLPHHTALGQDWCGTIIAVGSDGEEFASLTPRILESLIATNTVEE